MRKQLLRESVLFCTSQYEFLIGNRHELQAGIEGTQINYLSDIQEYWRGVLLDPDFRAYLLEADIDPIEFQQEVSQCQHEYLDRHGYYDMIRGGPPPPG